MNDVFLSYARSDSILANRIANALRKRRYTVFVDADSLVLGTDIAKKIAEEIENSKSVVLLLSKSSKGNKWVATELERALSAEKRVVPILLDDDAKGNWIWPLVSDKIALHLAEGEFDSFLNELIKSLDFRAREFSKDSDDEVSLEPLGQIHDSNEDSDELLRLDDSDLYGNEKPLELGYDDGAAEPAMTNDDPFESTVSSKIKYHLEQLKNLINVSTDHIEYENKQLRQDVADLSRQMELSNSIWRRFWLLLVGIALGVAGTITYFWASS